jgi:hypothetical protein
MSGRTESKVLARMDSADGTPTGHPEQVCRKKDSGTVHPERSRGVCVDSRAGVHEFRARSRGGPSTLLGVSGGALAAGTRTQASANARKELS